MTQDLTQEEIAFNGTTMRRKEAKIKKIEAKAKADAAFKAMNVTQGSERAPLEEESRKAENERVNAAEDFERAKRAEIEALMRVQNS